MLTSLNRFFTAARAALSGTASVSVAARTSDAVVTVVNNSNIVENPTLADFEALEPGDILVSSRIGSEREVLINNPAKKQLALRVTRDTVSALMSLPRLYRADGDKTPLSKKELRDLPPDTKLFYRRGKGGEYKQVTLHSVLPDVDYDAPVRGIYSCDEVISYKVPESIRSIATKIRKKPRGA